MKMRPQCDSASDGIPGTTEDSATRQRIGAPVFVGSSLFEWPLHTGLLQGLPGDRFLRGGSRVDHPFGIVQPPFRAETRMIPVPSPNPCGEGRRTGYRTTEAEPLVGVCEVLCARMLFPKCKEGIQNVSSQNPCLTPPWRRRG